MHVYHFYTREGFSFREWREALSRKIFIEVECNGSWRYVVRAESSKKKAIEILNAFIDRNTAINFYGQQQS